MKDFWGKGFLFVLLKMCVSWALAANPSVAFYYGPQPPLQDLKAFDIAVVEPAHVSNPARHTRLPKDGLHELFAYVALGEVQPSRPYYKNIPVSYYRADNAAWGSRVIDQTAAGWQDFFLDRIIAPLWEQGWRGFFLDTLDSYQLFAKTDHERLAQTKAMIATLRELKRRYPEARIILNRGFELLPEVAPLTFAVAAESLYQGYDAGKQRYQAVSSSDRAWLLAELEKVRDQYRLPVIVIDYVDPSRKDARQQAQATAKRIRAHGFIPWVADGHLSSLGVGMVEVIPRTVLVLVDSSTSKDLHYIEAQRFLGMPLNYLGLRYEFVDLVKNDLPEGIMVGRYAGIVTWFHFGVNRPEVAPWLKRRIDEGIRVAIFESFGFPITAGRAAALDLQIAAANKLERARIDNFDSDLIGFEAEPLPNGRLLVPVSIGNQSGRSLVKLSDSRGNTYDAAALTPWGGFVLAPFVYQELAGMQQSRWIVQPLTFLKQALNLPDLPVPDVTTEGGRRILMVHIDGDGFASRAEMPGAPFGAEIMRRELLERYRVPTTVSVIEGEIGVHGLYKDLSGTLEPIARRIFSLPHIEAAGHSYSHPFFWKQAVYSQKNQALAVNHKAGAEFHLPLPGYQFDLTREVKGSMDYINSRLLPPGKKAALMLWTGDCVPPPEALAEVDRHQFLNMNGGDTVITESNKSWTAMSAQGIRKDGWYQVFAPNQNENVYTNDWRGPFYGFERVIETFKLTENPVRFKPVNIYYHTYSATKIASLKALQKVYDWALAQPLTHLYASQYVRKVLDFESATIARDGGSGELIVRTGSDLRTLRLAPGASAPSLSESAGVAGIVPGPSGIYLTLAAGEVRLSANPDTAEVPNIIEANGVISDLVRTLSARGSETRFVLTSNGPAQLGLAHGGKCTVTVGDKIIHPTKDGIWATKRSAALSSSQLVAISHYVVDRPASRDGISLKHQLMVRCAK